MERLNKSFYRIMTLCLALMLFAASAIAAGSISTTVTMRVSKLTQNAVVNIGEDLSIEIAVDGVVPDYYQWYFNDEAIQGANQKVYNIVNAQLSDAGTYRMEAFDTQGKMLLSVDMAVRVTDNKVPKAGDSSQPLLAAILASVALVGFVTVRIVRRRV